MLKLLITEDIEFECSVTQCKKGSLNKRSFIYILKCADVIGDDTLRHGPLEVKLRVPGGR